MKVSPESNPFYPDLADGTTLQDLFEAAFREAGSRFEIPARDEKLEGITLPFAYARFESCPRSSQIYIASKKRLFIADYWEHGMMLANGCSADPIAVARSIDQWLTGGAKSIFDLAAVFPLVTPTGVEQEHDAGTVTAKKWQHFIADAARSYREPDLAYLAKVAASDPKVGILFPYTSMITLCLSRCTGYPFTRDTPSFRPLFRRWYQRKRRYAVFAANGTKLGEGSAQEVVAIASAQIPDHWGPAWTGTADDLEED